MSTQRSWLIVERDGTGHRCWYLRLLVRELQTRGVDKYCTVLIPQAVLDLPEWQRHMQEGLQSRASIDVASRLTFVEVMKRLDKGTYIVLPDGDRWLPKLTALAAYHGHGLRGAALLLRPDPGSSFSSKWAHALKRLLIGVLRARSPALRVKALRAAVTDRVESSVLDPVEFAPSPTSRNDWLTTHGIDPHKRVILVIGDLSERKCVPQLLDAMAHIRTGSVMVLVGKLSRSLRESVRNLARSSADIEVREGFVSDEEFDTWINCVDAVSILHRNEGSSGVLLKAWAAGTPVIVGGAKSVVAAARDLDCPRVESRGLDPRILAADLDEVVGLAGASPARSLDWEKRSRAFTSALLGLD